VQWLPNYFLALEVRANAIKTILATMHRHEITNMPKGMHHSPGDKIRGIINPVSKPIVTIRLIINPPAAMNMPRRR